MNTLATQSGHERSGQMIAEILGDQGLIVLHSEPESHVPSDVSPNGRGSGGTYPV